MKIFEMFAFGLALGATPVIGYYATELFFQAVCDRLEERWSQELDDDDD